MAVSDDRIATYRQEAFDLRASAEAHLARIDQILSIGAVFVAGVATAAVKDRELALGLPAGVFFLIALVTQVYTDVVVLNEARAAAESALDRELGGRATFYGDVAERFRRGPYLSSVFAVGAGGIVVAVGAAIGCGFIADATKVKHDPVGGHTVLIAYGIATVFFGLTALAALRDFRRASEGSAKARAELQAATPAA